MLRIPDEEISQAIEVATLNSHWPVIQLLLDDAAKRQSIKPHIKSILKAGRQRQQSQIVDLALALASEHCSVDETTELKQKLVTAADKYHHDSKVSRKTLVLDFAESCEAGNV